MKSDGACQHASFFSIKTQFENVGDALINRELIRLVSAHSAVVVDVSRSPASFINTLGLEQMAGITKARSFHALFVRLLASRITGRDVYYFLSPGGYVGEKSGRSRISAWLNTAMIRVMTTLGVRVCHVGVSYEGLGTNHIAILKARSPLLYRHLVRDNWSAEYIKQFGIRVDGLMPDLAWQAAATRPQSVQERNSVAFSLRSDQSAEQETTIRALVSHLDETISPELGFKFVTQVQRDADLMRQLATELQQKHRRHVMYVDTHSSIDDTFGAYDDCQYVIANRLHALIIGSVSGAIPIAIISAQNRKIAGLFETLGLEENCIISSEADGFLIAEKMKSGTLKVAPLERQLEGLKRSIVSLFPEKGNAS